MNSLLVDAGNTRIKWRVVDARTPECPPDDMPFDAVATTDLAALASAWTALRDVVEIVVSNVAGPAIATALRELAARSWPAARVEWLQASALRAGVENGYRDPARLGSDRWAALLGARARRPQHDQLVCAFGTATTLDLLLAPRRGQGAARFVGGLILPGLETMRRSLARGTAQLPDHADFATDVVASGFGTSTEEAIATGIVDAQAGALARAASRAHSFRVDERVPFVLALAGGGADAMVPAVRDLGIPFERVPDLVLRGLQALRGPSVDATMRASPDPSVPCAHSS